MSRVRAAVVASVVVVVGVVGITVAGPLQPPAGPVTATDPDLGQILDAVGSAGAGCDGVREEAGAVSNATMFITGLGSFEVLEFSLGAQTSPSNFGTGATLPSRRFVTVARLVDANSPLLLEALVKNTFFDNGSVNQTNPAAGYTFTELRPISIENRMVATCKGGVAAELVTFEFQAIEYAVGGVTYGYDFRFNQDVSISR
jgi:hypothetical protein